MLGLNIDLIGRARGLEDDSRPFRAKTYCIAMAILEKVFHSNLSEFFFFRSYLWHIWQNRRASLGKWIPPTQVLPASSFKWRQSWHTGYGSSWADWRAHLRYERVNASPLSNHWTDSIDTAPHYGGTQTNLKARSQSSKNITREGKHWKSLLKFYFSLPVL